MTSIAREFAHAEVAYVMAASGADHDLKMRFFNSRKEAPFVGHATIAAHAVLLALGRRTLGVSRQQSGIGVVPVTARWPQGARLPRADRIPADHAGIGSAPALQSDAAGGRSPAAGGDSPARGHARARRP